MRDAPYGVGEVSRRGPRGNWPAEEFARARQDEGLAAEVVMDLDSDAFLVVVPQRTAEAVG